MTVFKPGQGTDDCSVYSGSTIELSSPYLIMGAYDGSSWSIGTRFVNVTIPQGSTITAAKVTFQAYDNQSGTICNCQIKGEAIDDAATFSDYSNYIGRTRTTAYVDWSGIGAWTSDVDYDSPEIKTIIQEIVNRAGWLSGNDLVLFFADASSSSAANRSAESYDYDTDTCPRLTVTWTESGSSSESPSSSPSLSPSVSESPSSSPSLSPSASESPSISPSISPSESPSSSPSLSPSASISPSASPSLSPSSSISPSESPSLSPSSSISPSESPSLSPSSSISPSTSPSSSPSESPSGSPSLSPSASESPSESPSISPSESPSESPSASPSIAVEGEFEFPIMVMTGTSLRQSFSSGEFVFPIMQFLDISPDHSRGSFTYPIMIMEGWSRTTPITEIYRGIAMNLINQAISTYSNYPLNSLAYFKGKYLGATDSGIYILSGNLDNGRQIISKCKTGPIDLGTKFTKYIRDVWLTYRTDGHLALVFSVDEDNSTEVERETQVASNELQEEKIKVPRGLKGRYYTIELKNLSGADFDIDKLEIMVDAITGKKR